MKSYTVIFAMLFTITLAIDAQYDAMYFWKDGIIINKQSIKEVDSVLFYNPISNLPLNLNAFPENGGDVSGAGIYDAGEELTITATPYASYVFVNWTGDIDCIADSNASTTTLIMPDSGISLTANFRKTPEANIYTLSLNVAPENGGLVSGEGIYETGAMFHITAKPNACHSFINWTGDTDYIADPNVLKTILIMPGYDISLTANFKEVELGEFTDSRDGTVYQTVTIGKQVWMTENLKYLPSVVGVEVYSHFEPCYYVSGYNGTSVDDAKATARYNTYGVLYNWPAAMAGSSSSSSTPSGVQGVCPTGWYLPSDSDWTELTDYLGGESIAGAKLKEDGTIHWTSANVRATNETCFSALPGGSNEGVGTFTYLRLHGFWWSATESGDGSALNRSMSYHLNRVGRGSRYKTLGFSVRCVSEAEIPETSIHTLNLDVFPQGSGIVSGGGSYQLGAEISIAATPNASYVFVNWTGDTDYLADPNAFSTTLTMPGYDIHLTANFEVVEGLVFGELFESRDENVYEAIQIGNKVRKKFIDLTKASK